MSWLSSVATILSAAFNANCASVSVTFASPSTSPSQYGSLFSSPDDGSEAVAETTTLHLAVMLPSSVAAVMYVSPSVTAVISPHSLTVATEVSSLFQLTLLFSAAKLKP